MQSVLSKGHLTHEMTKIMIELVNEKKHHYIILYYIIETGCQGYESRKLHPLYYQGE